MNAKRSGCAASLGCRAVTEEVRLLLERSDAFETLALEALRRGLYDIAAFMLEQSVQLRLKATLLRLRGGYPRVHSLRYLLSLLASTLEELGFETLAAEVRRFARERREELILLEEAYTEARYGLGGYTRGEVEELLNLTREVKRLLERVEASVLG